MPLKTSNYNIIGGDQEKPCDREKTTKGVYRSILSRIIKQNCVKNPQEIIVQRDVPAAGPHAGRRERARPETTIHAVRATRATGNLASGARKT